MYFTGWGLSPILFGKMVDASCLIWQYPCSSSGACELYDFRHFRLSFHGFSLAMKCIALGFTISLILLTRKWKNWKFSHENERQQNNVDTQYNNVASEDMEFAKYEQSYSIFVLFFIRFDDATLFVFNCFTIDVCNITDKCF